MNHKDMFYPFRIHACTPRFRVVLPTLCARCHSATTPRVTPYLQMLARVRTRCMRGRWLFTARLVQRRSLPCSAQREAFILQSRVAGVSPTSAKRLSEPPVWSIVCARWSTWEAGNTWRQQPRLATGARGGGVVDSDRWCTVPWPPQLLLTTCDKCLECLLEGDR